MSRARAQGLPEGDSRTIEAGVDTHNGSPQR